MFGIDITGSLLFVCIFGPEYFYLRKICPESFCRDETPYFENASGRSHVVLCINL